MLANPQSNLNVLVALHLLCPLFFFYVCPLLVSPLPSQMFSFSSLPLLAGHVTLLPSRKSLSTICLAGCNDFGSLAEQINSVKLMTLSAGINFARVSVSE